VMVGFDLTARLASASRSAHRAAIRDLARVFYRDASAVIGEPAAREILNEVLKRDSHRPKGRKVGKHAPLHARYRLWAGFDLPGPLLSGRTRTILSAGDPIDQKRGSPEKFAKELADKDPSALGGRSPETVAKELRDIYVYPSKSKG
jgi:hypothetical protein